MNRRTFIKTTAQCATGLTCFVAEGAEYKRRIKIGACDWSLGKMADPEALKLAKRIGLDGVQISLGSPADGMHLRKAIIQEQYKTIASESGMEVLSLAIGELNNVPYKSDPQTISWVSDSIDACQAMDCKVILLAFFHKNDLRDDNAGVNETVRRLREVAPKAEKKQVILGIESWLSAEEHMRIIDRIGSSAVKVYYDVANATERGYDIGKEIRWLGKRGQICEFHMKENGNLLGQGRIDFLKVREAIEEIGYMGAFQIEGAIPRGAEMLESYTKNQQFLRKVFSPLAG